MTNSFNENDNNLKELIVEDFDAGRADVWLAKQLSGSLSRSRIQALINDGHVLLNSKQLTSAKRKLTIGDSLIIAIPPATEPDPEPEDIPLEVLYEDEHLIVIAKPPGLVVHPGAGNGSGTLVNALIHHCGDSLSGIGGVKRPGIVHRLDKDTSGVMVVAKNDLAHRHLADQFADHGKNTPLERAYLALVWGRLPTLKSKIDLPIGRSPHDRIKRAVSKDLSGDARHAVTHYTVQKRYGEGEDGLAQTSLIECRLETGRTHQIRVHLAHLGFPLIGDNVYGGAFKTKVNKLPDAAKEVVQKFPRQALHAYLLQFEHPATGETVRFEMPIPNDMSELIEQFELLK